MTPTTIWGAALDEVRTRVGSISQVARAEEMTFTQGPARGTRVIRVETGGGLCVDVLPDRALDLGAMTFRGVPLSWIAPPGFGHPALASQRGTDWLRMFGGGMLTTCGLDAYGPPSIDDGGTEYPMHGRISSTSATVTRVEVAAEEIVVEGEVRQARVFGENLVLRRKITAPLGGTSLRIEDVVTNEAHQPSGHMILYHCNLGWPLVSEHAELEIPSNSLSPRDADAARGVATWHTLTGPQPDYAEQVFRHDFRDLATACVSVDNAQQNTRLELRFDTTTLPALHQWKMLGEGHYVLGLEPTNVDWSRGRVAAEEDGVLPVLQPGESASYVLEFSAGVSRSEPHRSGSKVKQ
ncbi:MAG TPA: DUF4432 domain-containing protein [Microbacterium sp.]|nr:DUF4432 domain-containing protein [Microbacterium sp.]